MCRFTPYDVILDPTLSRLCIFIRSGVSITIPQSYSKNMLPNETLTEVNIGKNDSSSFVLIHSFYIFVRFW